MLESQCPSIRSFCFYPKVKYEDLYLVFHENIKSWKGRRRKILQADSAGMVRLQVIVRDFSGLQPREVITILAILFGKSRSKKSAMTYLKQIMYKKRANYFSTKTRIGIKLGKLETHLEIINLLFSKCSPI